MPIIFYSDFTVRQDSKTGISHVSVAFITKFQSSDCIPHVMRKASQEKKKAHIIIVEYIIYDIKSHLIGAVASECS